MKKQLGYDVCLDIAEIIEIYYCRLLFFVMEEAFQNGQNRICVVIAWVIRNIDPAKLNELCATVCIPCSVPFFTLYAYAKVPAIHDNWMHASGPFIEVKQNKPKHKLNVNKKYSA